MRSLLKLALVLGALGGCQGLLGIEDATLRQEGGGGSTAQGGSAGAISMAGSSAGEGGAVELFRYEQVADIVTAMVVGSDGNFWLGLGNSIRRVTPNWKLTNFALPEGTTPEGLALGADDNVWFSRGDRVGRVTPSGSIMEFMLPGVRMEARSICAGPDRKLWFLGSSTLGSASLSGEIELYTVPENHYYWLGIAAGADGTIWINDEQQSAIHSVDQAGTYLDDFALPTKDSGVGELVPGPDNTLWFAQSSISKIGKIVTKGAARGTITEYPLPVGRRSGYLVPAADGAIWILLDEPLALARMTASGEITDTFPLPAELTRAHNLLIGPDDNIWFTAEGFLVRFDPP